MDANQIKDRKTGTLYGLAIGDALGAAVEFMPWCTFPPVTGYRAGGPHGLRAGQWTDDTSMALALAHALKDGFDLRKQLDNYVAWREDGVYSVNGRCFDIGITTSGALSAYLRDKDPLTCARFDERSSGNGSIMRLAPIAIKYYQLYYEDFERFRLYAAQSSITTHGSDQCRSACSYMACVLARLISGEDRMNILNDADMIDRLKLDKHVLSIIDNRVLDPNAHMIGSGWVIESLQAAMWSFYTSENFEQTVLRAVNLGNDADTTGAVAGQFAGACWGISAIPAHLIDGLDGKSMINRALEHLNA